MEALGTVFGFQFVARFQLPFAAVHIALPANATLANRKETRASAAGKLHACTDVAAKVARRMNIVFGFFIK